MSKVAKWIFPAAGGKDGIIGTAKAVVGIMTGNWGMIASGVAQVAGMGKKAQGQARQASVLQLTLGETPREAVLGQTCTGGSLVDVFNFGGQYKTDKVTRCVALADHAIDGIVGFYIDDTYYPWVGEGLQAAFSNKLSFHFRNASPTGHAPPQHVMENGGWVATDRMVGITHIWIDWYVDEKVWPQGHPAIRFVLRGLRAYDPRFDPQFGYSGPNPQTWEDRSSHRFTRNAKVLRYAYTRGIYAEGHHGDPNYLLIGRGLTAEEAPPAAVIADANLCDEVVDGVPRYTVGGVISAAQPFIDVDGMFAAAMAGVIVQREGTVDVEAGQAKAVVVTITDDDLVVGEPVSFSRFLPDNDGGRINTVMGRYIEPALGYKDHSAPVRRSLEDIQADGGPREQTVSLPLVDEVKQADRIIEIQRLLGRLERRASIVLPPKFAGLEEGDWIAWQSQRRHGGATVRYRVETYRQPETWRMYLTLREIASSVFGVPDPIEDHVIPPPAPIPLDALSLLNVTAEAITLPGETSTLPAIRFRWTAPVDAAVLAIRAEVRRVGETEAAPTRTEDVNAGELVTTNGVGADIALEARLVPIGDPSRPVVPTTWTTVSTATIIAGDTTHLNGTPVSEITDRLQSVEAVAASTQQGVADLEEVFGDTVSAAESALLAGENANLAVLKAGDASAAAAASNVSAGIASTKADEAGNSATAANVAKVAAEAARDTASGQATASATSAASAAASATTAGEKATAADASATQAATRAGEALTYRNQTSASAADAVAASISAGTSATTAQGAQGAAEAARDQAATSAATAVSQASSAGASAAAASISANLAASVAGAALNKNSTYAIWPLGQSTPDNIGSFGSGLTVSRGAGKASPNAITLEAAAGSSNNGVEVAWTAANWNGRMPVVAGQPAYWIIDYKIEIGTGGLNGPMLRFLLTNAATGASLSNTIQKPLAELHTSTGDDQIIEGAYFFQCDLPAGSPPASARLALFTRVAAVATYNRIIAHKLAVRMATPSEIAAQVALPAAEASLAITAAVAADAQTRLSSARFEVIAAAGGSPAQLLIRADSSGSLAALVAQAISFSNVIGGTVVKVMEIVNGSVFITGVLVIGTVGAGRVEINGPGMRIDVYDDLNRLRGRFGKLS